MSWYKSLAGMGEHGEIVARLRTQFAAIQSSDSKIRAYGDGYRRTYPHAGRVAVENDIDFDVAADIVIFGRREMAKFSYPIWKTSAFYADHDADRVHRLSNLCNCYGDTNRDNPSATWIVAMYGLGFRSYWRLPKCLPMAPPNPDGVAPHEADGKHRFYCAVCRKHLLQGKWVDHIKCLERVAA